MLSRSPPTSNHLGKDTASRPHVNSSGVELSTQQDFWGSVPSRGNVVCHCRQTDVWRIGGRREREGASQPEICQLVIEEREGERYLSTK